MDQEHLITGAARIVEMAGVAVLLFGAVLAAGAFVWRISRHASFHRAYHELGPTSGARSCWGSSSW